jgi:hypothetical protein
MIDKTYKAQVNLLLQVLPFVAKEECFTLNKRWYSNQPFRA